MRRVAHEPGVGEVLRGAGLPGGRLLPEPGGRSGAPSHVGLQDLRDEPGRLDRDGPFRVGPVLQDDVALPVLDPIDEDRIDLHPVVGERGVGGGHVERRHVLGPERQRDRQIGEVGGDPEGPGGVGHVGDADDLAQPQKGTVRGAQGLGPDGRHRATAAAEVAGPVGIGEATGIVERAVTGSVDLVGGHQPLLHRRGQHIGLERGACGPALLGGDVELVLTRPGAEPRTTDQCSHPAGPRLECGERRDEEALVVGLVSPGRGLGCGLGLRVVGGVDPQPTAEQGLGSVVGGRAQAGVVEQLPADLLDEVVGGLPLRRDEPGLRDRFGPVVLGLGFGDVAGVEQSVERDIAPVVGLIGVSCRVVTRRVGDQAGQHRRLAPVELIGCRAVEDLGRGADAVGTAAEVDGVEVGGEDLVLRQLPFEPDGDGCLGELAVELAVRADHAVLDQLLGDGRATLFDAAGAHVADEGPPDGLRVDPVVVVEALVLHHQHRRDEGIADLVEFDLGPVLDVVQHVELFAVAVVDDRAQRQFVETHLECGRGVGGEDVADPGGEGRHAESHDDAATDQCDDETQHSDDPTHTEDRTGAWSVPGGGAGPTSLRRGRMGR